MMENKKATCERQLAKPRENGVATNNTAAILPDNKPEVKPENAIQRLRIERHIPAADIVEVVRTLYPGYDKPLHSKVDNGERYGIQLRNDAEKLVLRHFAENAQKRHRNERRTKPKRISARVTETVYRLLQLALNQSGQTMQDYIEEMLLKQLTGGKDEQR